MRNTALLASSFTALALSLGVAPAARADVDIEGVLLLGTGINTGDAENNPYAFQFGGAGELTIGGWVLGVRATRSIGTNADCSSGGSACVDVKDLRTIGGDFGWDYEIALLHISPRVGGGYINEKDGERVTGYVEPGGVAEVELGIFVAGIDLRYRFAIKENDLNAFLGYARLGLRF